MRRTILAVAFAAIAAAVVMFLKEPASREWIAIVALPSPSEAIAVIETDKAASPLDAALMLRALLRFAPAGIVFLDPLEGSNGAPLLTSKLEDAHVPVVFTSNSGAVALPGITGAVAMPPLPSIPGAAPAGWPSGCTDESAQAGALVIGRRGNQVIPSNTLQILLSIDKVSLNTITGSVPGSIHAGSVIAPVDVSGRSEVNPLAGRNIQRIRFGRLMERTERSERGEISATLDNLFRGRVIAVEKTGGTAAIGLAALRDGLAESDAPLLAWIGVVLAASLPFWPMTRISRTLLALLLTCAWLLMAVAVYQQFRVTVPLATAALLPILALIPRGSNKVERRELPA